MGVSFEDVVLAEVLVSGMVPPIGKNTYHTIIVFVELFHFQILAFSINITLHSKFRRT